MAGHYPWQKLLDRHLPSIQEAYPDVLLIWGTEASVGGKAVKLPGDHAAREETSYGLALFPGLVDMDAMHSGRNETESWPEGQVPPLEQRHLGVEFNANHPLFAQLGEDARTATTARGEDGIARLVDFLSGVIMERL